MKSDDAKLTSPAPSEADRCRESPRPTSWAIRRADGAFFDHVGGPGEKYRWVTLEDASTYRTEQAAVDAMFAHYRIEQMPMQVVGIITHPSWREVVPLAGTSEKP